MYHHYKDDGPLDDARPNPFNQVTKRAAHNSSRKAKKERKQLALVSKNNESLVKIADKIEETKNIESVRSIEIPSEVYNDKGPVLKAEVQ